MGKFSIYMWYAIAKVNQHPQVQHEKWMVSIWHFEKIKERICNTYSVQPKEMPFIFKLKKIIKEFCKSTKSFVKSRLENFKKKREK
jgi:hypothetical protein